MKLYEARVDLNGQIVASGQLVHAADVEGHFVPTRHDNIRIRARFKNIRLAAATAFRDPISNFLVAKELSPVVILPESLSLLIQNALGSQSSRAVRATLATQEGRLDSGSSPETAWSQPLSGWKLEIVPDRGNLRFAISADLLAIDPLHGWQKQTGNYWAAADREPAKLQIDFCVDCPTRVALFGTSLSESLQGPPSDDTQAHMTTAANPRLGSAPVGEGGEIFGYSKDGSWMKIWEGRGEARQVTLERCNRQRRLPSGFISVDRGLLKPRLWFTGLDMDRIIEIGLGDGRRGAIELTDGWFGHLQGVYADDNPSISFGGVSLMLNLNKSGLEISYKATPLKGQKLWNLLRESGPWTGCFTIPWEILILRYPRAGNHRLRTIGE